MKHKAIPKERPFEYLRRKDSGALFDGQTVSDWYKARAFVLDELSKVSIRPEESTHLHVVILDDDGLMLSVIRHIALYAHFPNHDETTDECCRKRTVITLISRKEDILDRLQKEECLGNLLRYCKHSFHGETRNKDSYIDIELEILDQWTESEEDSEEKRLVFRKSDVLAFCDSKAEEDIFCIDTRKAQYTNRMYCLGSDIDNLPYEDIHSVKRYAMALNVFQYARINKPSSHIVVEENWEKEENQSDVLNAMSNIFCADCYLIRYNSISPCPAVGKKTEAKIWEKYYDALSRSEHSRWVVEKLILGYRPYKLQERLMDESLLTKSAKRSQFRKALKKNWKSPAHIDLCSFADLRRIDPDTLKYDSFLVLGIPAILKKVGELDKRNKR